MFEGRRRPRLERLKWAEWRLREQVDRTVTKEPDKLEPKLDVGARRQTMEVDDEVEEKVWC